MAPSKSATDLLRDVRRESSNGLAVTRSEIEARRELRRCWSDGAAPSKFATDFLRPLRLSAAIFAASTLPRLNRRASHFRV